MLTKVYLYTLTHVNLHTFINPLNAASACIRPQLTIAHRAERICKLSRNTIPPQPYNATGAAHLYLIWKLGSSLFIPCFRLRKLQSHVFVLSKRRAVPTARIASLFVSQPSSVVLWIQNSDFSITLARLCVSQPSSVVLCKQNCVPIAPKLQVFTGPRPHLCISAWKTACLATK